jgi:hypothetical protein
MPRLVSTKYCRSKCQTRRAATGGSHEAVDDLSQCTGT